tara:strand:+ start:97 stop:303 length:207 start_codon:yes stop_codon:yes gene_type:complete
LHHSKTGDVMRNNPNDLSNQLLNKIKTYLKNETNFITLLGEPVADILLNRNQLAENLLEQITKWEEKK